MFYFQANKKKKAQKKFELKSEKKKKKKINRASPQKSPTSILNVKETQSKKIITQQMVNRKANPQILSKKKKKNQNSIYTNHSTRNLRSQIRYH